MASLCLLFSSYHIHFPRYGHFYEHHHMMVMVIRSEAVQVCQKRLYGSAIPGTTKVRDK